MKAMTYSDFLANTRRLLHIIDGKVNFLAADATDRNRVSAALLDVSQDHAKTIVLALEQHLYGSAYALERPLLECFTRAAWILHCASEDQIQQVIRKDSFDLSLLEMLNAVEKGKEWPDTLSSAWKGQRKALHSFTHGGLQIAVRRMKAEYIEHDVDELELMEILKVVCIISFLTLTEMIEMSRRKGLENDFLSDLLDDLCKWCFIKNKGRG